MLIRVEHSVIVCFFCVFFFWERPGRQFWWNDVQILCPKCSYFLCILEECCKCCLETLTNHVFVLPFAFLDVNWYVVLNTNVY